MIREARVTELRMRNKISTVTLAARCRTVPAAASRTRAASTARRRFSSIALSCEPQCPLGFDREATVNLRC